MRSSSHGFSLVELSIVLVILGLLVGGILAGQSLIRASELRSVASESQQLITGMHAFRDKYFAIPGDMANATSIWGIAGGGNGTSTGCYNSSVMDGRTCDGNGDGLINNVNSNGENFRFWQHMANAGLIEGRYSGVSNDGDISHSDASTKNVKGAKIGGLWWINSLGTQTSQSAFFNGYYGATLQLGIYTGATSTPNQPILRASEAWNLDTKIDDSRPATGKMRVRANNSNCDDTFDEADLTANYQLNLTVIACNPLFISGY